MSIDDDQLSSMSMVQNIDNKNITQETDHVVKPS